MSRLIIAALVAVLPGCAAAAPPAPAVLPAEQPAQVASVHRAPLPVGGTPARDRPGIAVFPFTNGGSFGREREDLAALEVGIQGLLLTELQQNPALRIVERGVLRQMLDEQDLAQAGRVDPATAARVGRMVGARYAVTGTFMDLYGNFRLDGRIIDVETGEILRAVRIENERRENLYRLLVDMAGQIVSGVQLAPLAAEEQRVRQSRDMPDDAVLMLALAMDAQDNGRGEQAVELYRQIVQRFPQVTEARDALRQMEAES